MLMEQRQTNEVYYETTDPDNQHQLGVIDLLNLDQSFEGLHQDGETQCQEKNRVD